MSDRFRIVVESDCQVMEFFLPAHTEASEFDALNPLLARAIVDRAGAKWVVDLLHTRYAGSALLGMLVNIRTKVKQTKGKLVLCHLDPMLERVLRAGSMDRLFTIVSDRPAALAW